ncbi:hypothetical protein GE061_013795 [Apolygus lucorum]|uniref:CGG triplet repeat-binding protein 1 n=1 Tax=Apolygus lucorum TaxID=248454 RepID=A0A6A4K6U5_APOLU|nr:hypothetical protein GE061_013795 [Apolygus lucorum]
MMPTAKDLQNWIGSDLAFRIDGKSIFCQLCGKPINSEKKFLVDQHKRTKKHKEKVLEARRKDGQTSSKMVKQLSIPGVFSKQQECRDEEKAFKEALCKALLKANIPLNKVDNEEFKSFLSKYTGRKIPCESSLRKTYVASTYEKNFK